MFDRRIQPLGPLDLGAALIAWWVADAAYLTLSGSNVTAWAARVGGGGFTVSQGTGGAQPVFTPGALAGRDAVVFDGTDDVLEATGFPSGLPTGIAGTEIWAVCENTATDAVTRILLAYGAQTAGQHRRLTRGGGGVWAASDGSTTANSRMPSVGPSCIGVRWREEGAIGNQVAVNVSGKENRAGATGSVTGTRLRIGASALNTANAFWQGSVRHILITRPLVDAQVRGLVAWGSARAGSRL